MQLVTIILVICLIAASSAASIQETIARRAMPAVQHQEVHDEFGQFALRYVTAEGIVVSERGRLVPSPEGKGHVLITEGETRYIGDDGKTYVTKYSAGLEGTKMEGDHIPVPAQAAE